MKVRAYTIEWTENKDGTRHRRIAAFDDYGAARAKAIELLKARASGRYIHEHKEVHEVDKTGLVCERLQVFSWKNRFQVTIKYHAAPPAYNGITFW